MAPPVDPSSLDVGYLAAFVGMAYAGEVERQLARRGFGDARYSHGFVFQHLIDAERTVGELAERLQVTQQAASKSAAELEALGYVERVGDPRDARVRRVRLSPRGRELVETTRAIRAAVQQRLIRRHGERSVRQARALLAELLDTLGGTPAVRRRRVVAPR